MPSWEAPSMGGSAFTKGGFHRRHRTHSAFRPCGTASSFAVSFLEFMKNVANLSFRFENKFGQILQTHKPNFEIPSEFPVLWRKNSDTSPKIRLMCFLLWGKAWHLGVQKQSCTMHQQMNAKSIFWYQKKKKYHTYRRTARLNEKFNKRQAKCREARPFPHSALRRN